MCGDRQRSVLWAIVLVLVGTGCSAVVTPAKVEVREVGERYELYRNGAPYVIRGAGLGFDGPDVPAAMRSLQRHGGNSLRTWNVGDGRFLDLAHELGLTVALCLDVARERHGFDYSDPAAVREQFERLRADVLRHRNHPALLAWIIGNELNHDYSDPRVYDAVNDISRMIHELDPNHPTTTTTAGLDAELAEVIASRAPDLDFLSVQVYGGLIDLPETVSQIELNVPLMVTEWGTVGHWEVPATDWGAPIELNSSQKAAVYQRGSEQALASLDRLLIGNYAFLWGQKQERTPTWYGVIYNGHKTEAVDVLEAIWTGHKPKARAPKVHSLLLDGRAADESVRVAAGAVYDVVAEFSNPEGQPLRFEWRVLAESQALQSGGDAESVPDDHSSMLGVPAGPRVWLHATRPGAYRVFVYGYDEDGGVAHANLPFLVEEALR